MRVWVLWAGLALVSWGAWGFLSAKAAQHGNAQGLLAGAVLLEAVFVLPYLGRVPSSVSWWLVGTGLAGAVAYGAMFRALQTGPPASVVTMTAMYPVVTVLLTVTVLGEGMTWRKAVGIGLAILAVLLLMEER